MYRRRSRAICHADDQAVTANTEKDLQKILDETSKVLKEYGMKINIKKTKVMKIERQPSTTKITVDGEILQQVEEFKYLGSILSSSGCSENDIRVRIGMVKRVFNKEELGIEKNGRGMSWETCCQADYLWWFPPDTTESEQGELYGSFAKRYRNSMQSLESE